MYGLKRTAEPEAIAVELSTVTKALRWIDDAGDDAAYLHDLLIPAAVDWAESETSRQLITATYTLELDCFPANRICPILLPRAPLQSVTSVSYYDTDGVLQVWDAAEYDVSTRKEPGTIRPAFGERYPTTQRRAGAVEIVFVAGYGDDPDDVPAAIKQAMALVVGHWFANRESVVVGTISGEVAMSATNLIDKYKIGDAFHDYGEA